MPAALRRSVILIAALALTATIPTAASATIDGYKETSKSTFTLVPDEAVVHAASKVTVQNKRKSTVRRGPCKNAPRRTCKITTYYYIEGWGPIFVPADATNVSISGKGVEPVSIASDASGTTYVVRFPRLLHKKKQVIDITYDLPDAGPGAQGRTRVADAYARFCWSGEYADSGTVKAVLPAGWEATTEGARTKTATAPANTVVSLAKKKTPGGTELCTDAFLPSAMARTYALAPTGQVITLDSWPDDPEWTSTMIDTIHEYLPTLEETIGSPMPFASLPVQQVARTNGFGSPTDLDASAPRLLMDEDLGFEGAPVSALARTWFNDGSIADGWLAEGLTLWAGLSSTGHECPDPGEYPGEGQPSLREWQVGYNPSGSDPTLPVYLASAACGIIEEAADLIGPERMVDVIDSLRTGTPRYGARTTDLRATRRAADWADWLDAVDELGMIPAGGTDLELAQRALTRYGAAIPGELAGRFSARTLYHDTLAAMEGTSLPVFVDALMEAWSFDEAVDSILEARRVHQVISSRPALPDDIRGSFLSAFESATSPSALSALEGAVASWVPSAEPTPADA